MEDDENPGFLGVRVGIEFTHIRGVNKNKCGNGLEQETSVRTHI